jgi:hypothetical protein
MSPRQIVERIQAILAARTWPAGSRVFSSVPATPRGVAEAIASNRMPCAFIQVGPGTPDPDDSGLVEQVVTVFVFVAVYGNAVGGNAILGANRTGGAGASQGRGLLEIETQVKAAIQQLGPADNVNLIEMPSSDASIVGPEQAPHAAYREYSFRAWCTTQDE